MNDLIDAILVPAGSEYKSVCRGLSVALARTPAIRYPPILAIPIGVKPLTEYLEKWQRSLYSFDRPQPKVLLMGLCGSLTHRYSIGDIVLYESCAYKSDKELLVKMCDRAFIDRLSKHLKDKAFLVKSLTSDRLIYSASEKRHLAEIYDTEVVDMEGFAALEVLNKAGFAVAMLRVISDDSQHDLPNITDAISADGSLKSLPLTIGMLRQPVAAIRLIKGSLRGLKVLEKVTTCLFS